MNLFGKKKDVSSSSSDNDTKVDKKKDKIKAATYKVVLKEKLGSNTRTIKTIDAVRFVDPDDHVVYLQNAKSNFFEIFPEDMNQFVTYSEKEVTEKLEATRRALKKERESDNPDINDKNLEFDILKYEAIRRSFKFDKSASYVTFDEGGKPTFYFLRHGSTFYPFKWDPETKTIYTPSDNKKKKAAIALRNKRSKYKLDSAIQTSSLFFLAIAVIAFLAGAFMVFKSYDKYSENEINLVKVACLQGMAQSNAELKQSASNIAKITSDLNAQLNKPQTVIEGVQPR